MTFKFDQECNDFERRIMGVVQEFIAELSAQERENKNRQFGKIYAYYFERGYETKLATNFKDRLREWYPCLFNSDYIVLQTPEYVEEEKGRIIHETNEPSSYNFWAVTNTGQSIIENLANQRKAKQNDKAD